MENEQSLKQRKIALAQSEHAGTIIEFLKDLSPKTPIIAETEWETIVNAVRMDVFGTLILDMVKLLDDIRNGSLHE